MILLHEDMHLEAEKIALAIKDFFGLDTSIINKSLDGAFQPILEFDGFWYSSRGLDKAVRKYAGKAVIVVTPRDLYINDQNKEDDWIFGYYHNDLTVVAAARMKRPDNKPSKDIQVPFDLYIKRLSALAVHEIGHDVVKAPHFQPATWVNASTGYKLGLGRHCTDNSCIMYEVVDIRSPPPAEGYMLLGTEKKFDAGLDDVLERLNPTWFCDRCAKSIVLEEKHKKT